MKGTFPLIARISLEYYETGHMMYVHEPSIVKFKEDLARFVRAGQ